MASKRKISIRKILQVVLTLVVTTCCVAAVLSASKIEGQKTLKNIVIHYNNCKKYHSVEEKDIMDLAINNRHIDIWHMPMAALDIHTMERLIEADPWIANAQVFVDNERVLHMYVTQRIPVVRIFQQDGRSFYLDTTMSIMPLSGNYIYYTGVVTNVPVLKNDSGSQAMKKDILSLVSAIQADTFWAAQVSQIIVDAPGMYELVPVLGDHRILFGDVSMAKDKLHNLFLFYKNVLNRIGWDKYEVLDVRFNNQVVASPSLPFAGPVDKAVNTMNWITSMVEHAAMNDNTEAPGADEKKNNDYEKVKSAAAKAEKPLVVHKPVVNAAAGNLKKPVIVSPKKQQAKQNEKHNVKDKKKVTPKYIYPDKKDH